jgi:excisionase family DNA binding protein
MPFDGSLSERLPTLDEIEKAKQASVAFAKLIASGKALSLKMKQGAKGEEAVELPPAVGKIVFDLLMLIGKGEAVTLVPVGAELTTQEAADLLNVSRPFLVKLLGAGAIPFHKVGAHRRIRAEDVFAYKRKRDTTRKEKLDQLARLGQEIG